MRLRKKRPAKIWLKTYENLNKLFNMSAVAENGEYIFRIWELFMFHWYKKLEIDNILNFIIIQIVLKHIFQWAHSFLSPPLGSFSKLVSTKLLCFKFPNSVNSSLDIQYLEGAKHLENYILWEWWKHLSYMKDFYVPLKQYR